MKKRALSLLLCGLMTVSLLAGCGGQEEAAVQSAGEVADAGTEAAEGGGEKTPEGYQKFDDVKLDYLYCWNGGFQPLENQYDNDVAKAIRDKIGVTVEIEGVMMTESEKLNLMFASGDMPDIINAPYWGGADACTTTIRKAAAEGRLIDLKDKLPNYPNLQKAYEEGISSIQYLENELYHPDFNGGIYVLPWQLPGSAQDETNWAYGIFVRQDVADALGVDPSTIKTQEQLWDFMMDAKEYGFKDVNGNDCIVATTYVNGSNYGDYVAGFDEKKLTNYSLDENGKITSDVMTENWMDKNLFLWRMVNEGLMDVECFKQSQERADEKIGNGTALFASFQYSVIVNATQQSGLYDAHPEMRYVPVGPLDYRDGQSLVQTATDGRTGSPCLVFPTTCKDIDAALTWLDYLNSEEGMRLASYGFEGDTYEMNAEGQPRMTEEWSEKYRADAAAAIDELRQRGIGYLNTTNHVVDFRKTWWGEQIPFQADAAIEEVENYKKLRPVERLEGYPLNAFEAQFERYEDWLDLQAQLGEDDYVQRAYFAETEEEARKLLEEYRGKLRTGMDGIYDELMEYLTEMYNSRDDIAL